MVVTHLLAADLMQRKPIVQWGTEGPYANGTADTFDLYFEPVSDTLASDLSGSIYPTNWTNSNLLDELPFPHTGEIHEIFGGYHLCGEKGLVPKSDRLFRFLRHREEDIVVVYCWQDANRILRRSPRRRATMQDLRIEMMRDRIILKPELQDQIATYRATNLDGHPVMSVHLRGSDKVYENSLLNAQNEAAFALSRDWIEGDGRNLIFLATDTARYVNRWKEAFGEDRVRLQNCLRSEHETPNFLREGSDGYRNGCEVILDTYIAAGCDRFVGNSSSTVARYVAAIGQFPPDRLHWLDQ
ncbi:hypothetical protein C1J05_19740 [Sulfitobacter sp. JL08]|nr:hypothetical protein C1J05_19740 [Sulfitobacter sp. JL08]